MAKTCKECGKEIPQERLDVLPDTETCVEHSDVEDYVGFMVFGHKTGAQFVAINPKDKESLRLARRADERKR